MRPGDFIAAVREEFPELDSVIKEDEGLFYLQVGSLASYTQGAIDDGDGREVQRQFEFMRRAWLAGDDEVQNALGVAYLEHLNFQRGSNLGLGLGVFCLSLSKATHVVSASRLRSDGLALLRGFSR